MCNSNNDSKFKNISMEIFPLEKEKEIIVKCEKCEKVFFQYNIYCYPQNKNTYLCRDCDIELTKLIENSFLNFIKNKKIVGIATQTYVSSDYHIAFLILNKTAHYVFQFDLTQLKLNCFLERRKLPEKRGDLWTNWEYIKIPNDKIIKNLNIFFEKLRKTTSGLSYAFYINHSETNLSKLREKGIYIIDEELWKNFSKNIEAVRMLKVIEDADKWRPTS